MFKLSRLAFICCLIAAFAAPAHLIAGTTNEWTWMGGSSTVPAPGLGNPGVYGRLGTFAAGNIPRARRYGLTWVDNSGNVWLFGGDWYDAAGNYVILNDLWEYNPSTNEWAWMGGSETYTNNCTHGSCGASGVYGTLGTPAATNIPGSRTASVRWTDSNGHFWLFGGLGYDAAGNKRELNDLWEFNPSTTEWTWMGGSSTINTTIGGPPGVYGTLGTPSSSNIPGGRAFAVSWVDNAGNFWLFGGAGFDSTTTNGAFVLNDLWKYSPSTNEWTWVSGSNVVSPITEYASGVYGTKGTPAAGNVPTGREDLVAWVDSNNNFWLFGGYGADVTGDSGKMNDLWEFNPSTSEWTWMSGSDLRGQSGVYGTQGTPAASNVPGGRYDPTGWNDHAGHLVLFGGAAVDSTGAQGSINDLWVYTLATNEWTWIGGSNRIHQSGVYGTLGTPAASNTPGGRYSVDGMSWVDGSGNFWLFGGHGYDSGGNYGTLNDLWRYQPMTGIIVPPGFTLSVSGPVTVATPGQSGTTTITLTPSGGFNGTVTFGCTGLPSGASCSFTPVSATTTTLTVNTSSTTVKLDPRQNPFVPLTTLAALLCCFGLRKRRGLQMMLLAVVCGLGLTVLNGCGGSSGSGGGGSGLHTPHTITVTGISGSINAVATFSLTVN